MTSCRRIPAALTADEAYAAIEPFFVETRRLFIERGLTRVKETRLLIDPEAHDTPRHFAGCIETGKEIVVAPEFATLPVDNVVAIIAHEFGHACDFLYPGRFFLAEGELVSMREAGRRVAVEDMDQRSVYNVRKQWETRDAHAVEVTADRVAEFVTSRTIQYAGPCMLQTYGPGKSRPRALR